MYVDEINFQNPELEQVVKLYDVITGGTPYLPETLVEACMPGTKPKTNGFAIPWAGEYKIIAVHGRKVAVNTNFELMW